MGQESAEARVVGAAREGRADKGPNIVVEGGAMAYADWVQNPFGGAETRRTARPPA